MATWRIYGNAWFMVDVEADDQEDAEYIGLSKLMDCDTVRFNIQMLESELTNA